MPDPPDNYNICPCCGTEFEYTNAGIADEHVRAKWLSKGAPWSSRIIPRPHGWSALRQLAQAGFYTAIPSGRERIFVANWDRSGRVGKIELADTQDATAPEEIAS